MTRSDIGGSATYQVVGIGNALVDVIVQRDDDFLVSESLVKGSMALIETDRAVSLYKAMGPGIEMSGGSAANTMTGVASFGGSACYIGKVCHDELGDVFAHDMRAMGVAFALSPGVHPLPTGRSMIIVTPDAQRTMNTFLGCSSLLDADDVDAEVVAAGAVLYMEGYLWDKDAAKDAYRKAARVSHDAGRMVSLSLSDSFCVDRHRADFRRLVTDEVDLLFGNEDELLSLYEVESFTEAVRAVRHDCKLAAVTPRRGRLGGHYRRRRHRGLR